MESRPLSNPQEFWSTCLQSRISELQTAFSRGNADAIALALQTIDDELAALHLTMCALRTRRNSIPPVSRLPSEILAHVFLFCRGIFPPRFIDADHETAVELGWLQVTHVCKGWHETALHYPHLWAKVDDNLFRSTPWLQAVLARGRSAPITLTLNYSIPRTPDMEEVSKHVSRIRDMSLEINDGPVMKGILQPILSSSANILQTIYLTKTTGPSLWLPIHMFQDHAPMLHSVTLLGVYIHWSAPVLRNLTKLDIELQGSYPDQDFLTLMPDSATSTMSSFDELLHGLRNMSALQELRLSECLPSRSSHSTEEGIVDLPCLKSLTIDDDLRCLDLFKCLSIPSSCNLNLLCYDEDPESHLFSKLDSLVHVHVNRETGPLESLTLMDTGTRFSFTFSRIGNDGETELKNVYERTVRGYPLHSVPDFKADIISTWCHKVHIESIRRLKLTGYDVYRMPSEWVETFGRCKAVEEVEVSGDDAMTLAFCTALAMRNPQSTAGEETAFLPNLRHLRLHGTSEEVLKQLAARQQVNAIQHVCQMPVWPKYGCKHAM